jgi:hypothetical protein
MNLSEIAILLGFIGIYDLRVQVDELKVRAWSESLDKDLSLEEAKKIVSLHYSNSDLAVSPSYINRAWRLKLKSERDRKLSQAIGHEIEQSKLKAVPLNIVKKYTNEIRESLNRGQSEVEENSRDLAFDP